MRREESRARVFGFLGSLAIHLAAAAIAFSLSGPVVRHVRARALPSMGVGHPPGQSLASTRPGATILNSARRMVIVLIDPSDERSRVPADGGGWLDHLWQSTVFAVAVGLLTFAFRRNGAHVRYWLWLAASVKFLVPFALLIAIGSRVPWTPTSPPATIVGVWAVGFATIAMMRLRMWRRIRAAVRASTPATLSASTTRVEIRSTPGLLEPGVVGWWRPILLVPADIERHLTPPQLEAVVAHELCHVERRDNLTAAIQMVVEAIFWFHPLVWWIGARLVAERERACDEHVLGTLRQPAVYAQGIVNVCKRYVESPLVCVSGVSGSSIVKRVDAILRNDVGEAIGPFQRAVLVTAINIVVLVPIGVGVMRAAQGPPQPPDATIDAATRNEVIDGALKALNDAYVSPEIARKMEEAIRSRQQRREYDAVTSGRQLAQMLTDHLREVSHDRHLSVNFMPQGPPPIGPPQPGGGQTLEERQRTILGRQNFGFARVERLAGNIGYVDLRGFMPPAVAGETATAAMTFLASSDAVIFDLRQNGGGDPSMVAFLTSYLFGTQPVHLNDFYSRVSNETRQSWTLPYVPGARLTDKDVYILTSARTFSGAEEFTYNLKNLKRAIVVGETTGGGAHTVSGRRINSRFSIAVPSGQPINAVTGANWEGVGVEPDVKVSADDALKAAHFMALEKQRQALPPDAAGLRNEVARTIETVRAELGAAVSSIEAFESRRSVPASKASEDFESGTLANWIVDRRGPGGWYAYTNGKTTPDPARNDPAFPFDIPDPPQGKAAAVTEENGPGRFILYRDVALDGRYRLRMTIFYVNAGTFSAAPTSSRNTITEEQQYRIDLVSPAAPLDSVARDHVLATIFEAKPGDPPRRQPTEVTFDLSPWNGQTVRLRLAVGENQAPLRAGVDDIRFERIEP